MGRHVRVTAVAIVALATAAVGLTGCQNARIGARCHTTDFGQTATQILQCKRGRWRVLMSKAQYAQILIAIHNANTTTTTPPPPPATTTTQPLPPPPPPALPYAISGGYQHSCAIVAGTVMCVGRNNYGQLGNGTAIDSTTWVSTGITDAVSVSAGTDTSCAVKADGTAWCWGSAANGALGNGSGVDSPVPVQVSGITDATQISAGDIGACVRTSGGLAECWGFAYVRGDGSSVNTSTPVTAWITDVTKVAVGHLSVCALTSDQTVFCWGGNGHGQLGDGTWWDSYTPVQATGVSAAIDVASGGGSFSNGGVSCAVLADGTAKCWGEDVYGMVGDDDGSTADQSTPTLVAGLGDATDIAVGDSSTCALRTTGGVKCWGAGGYLGDGTTNPATAPVDVVGVTGASAIASDGTTVCALLSTNGAKCWGDNSYGATGAGNNNPAYSPMTVLGMP